MTHREEARRSRTAFDRAREAAASGPYRIAAVAKLTGVPAITLRAWERRYGIPAPERAVSGYRLYGAAQVREVQEMRRLCGEGLAAAEAAKVVASMRGGPVPEVMPAAAASDVYETIIASILASIERYDEAALEGQLRRLLFFGSASTILDRVLAPVLHRVGEGWCAGKLTLTQEHFATHRLGALLWDLVRLTAPTEPPECVLLASFADDEHELGILGVGLHVAEWRMRPIVLGARTPPSAVKSAVEAWSPRVVALSATLTPPRPRARELLRGYVEACGSVPLVVGGKGAEAIEDLIEASGAIYAPPDPAELRAIVHRLARTAARPGKRGGRR